MKHRMKVLVVGGAGYVASIIRPALEAKHDCYYYDRNPIPGRSRRATVADVLDEASVQRAVRGMDAIIYMAMGVVSRKPSSGYRSDIQNIRLAFGVNTAGPYAFIRYGHEAGARRFIYASSLSVYTPEVRPRPYDERTAPNAWHPYGISKRAGELVCRAAADQYPNAVVIALRLFAPRRVEELSRMPAEVLEQNPFMTPRDTARLFLAALACNKKGAHFLNVSGDLHARYYRHTLAKRVLGWTPLGR